MMKKNEFNIVIHKKRIKTTKTKYNVEEYLEDMNFSYGYIFEFKKECFCYKGCNSYTSQS